MILSEGETARDLTNAYLYKSNKTSLVVNNSNLSLSLMSFCDRVIANEHFFSKF